MHEAIARMLAKYEPKSVDDSVRALREIIRGGKQGNESTYCRVRSDAEIKDGN